MSLYKNYLVVVVVAVAVAVVVVAVAVVAVAVVPRTPNRETYINWLWQGAR